MKNYVLCLVSSLFMVAPAFAVGTKAAAAAKAETHAATAWDNEKVMMEHLDKHVKYPATRQQVLDACKEVKNEYSQADHERLNKLPEGTYKSSAEVVAALKK